MACEAYACLKKITTGQIGAVAAGGIIYAIIAEKLYKDTFDYKVIYIAILLFDMQTAREFDLEVATQHDDHCQKANGRKGKQYDVGPIVGAFPKEEHNSRSYHRCNFKQNQGNNRS